MGEQQKAQEEQEKAEEEQQKQEEEQQQQQELEEGEAELKRLAEKILISNALLREAHCNPAMMSSGGGGPMAREHASSTQFVQKELRERCMLLMGENLGAVEKYADSHTLTAVVEQLLMTTTTRTS